MKERLQKALEKIKNNWREKTKRQKSVLIGSIILFITIISVLIYFTTRTTMVPLYSDLTPAETGSIKEALDEKGVKSEIADNGTTIKVPKDSADSLLVELASEGIPKSGSIDYSYFSENAGLGMTDNEFDVMKLDAMQTELENLIKNIDGIKDANVMITLPDKSVFVKDDEEEASASIVLTTESGYNFSNSQIKALYTLVSKSVPNLPTDNIVIMDQNFEYYDLEDTKNSSVGSDIQSQYSMKKEIEKDLQRQVQSMLGTLMGQNKVVVSVTADIDFSQETRDEKLVEPVDKDNMEGIAVSAKKISENYTGKNAENGGVPQAEDTNDTLTGYAEDTTNGSGEYEKTDETINYEVNKIHKKIVESPYKIKDLGIQVIVEPPDSEHPNSVSAEVEDGIKEMLSTIIRTSISKTDDNTELTDEDIENKVSVTFQPLLGKTASSTQTEKSSFPVWGYIVIGLLVVAIIVLLILFLRKRREDAFEEEELIETEKEAPVNVPDVNEPQETEETLRKKQIEKMAKERPEEFVKLIRTWLSQD